MCPARRTRFGLTMAAALTLAGCATAGGGPSYPSVDGSYTGGVTVEGQGIDGTLEVRQDGPELSVLFDAPAFGLVAEGAGTVEPDGSARIFLDYDLQCPGRAELAGRFTPDGTGFSGNVTAADCTGQIGGTFSFRR